MNSTSGKRLAIAITSTQNGNFPMKFFWQIQRRINSVKNRKKTISLRIAKDLSKLKGRKRYKKSRFRIEKVLIIITKI